MRHSPFCILLLLSLVSIWESSSVARFSDLHEVQCYFCLASGGNNCWDFVASNRQTVLG